MDDARWYRSHDGTFSVQLPDGWLTEPDAEQGGVELWHPDGAGELSLLAFPLAPGEPPDPGEELYAFLDEHEIELEEDDIEDLELSDGGELALCEYLTEDEDSGEAVYWLVGVGALPGALVFANYTCAAGEEEIEREVVHSILRTLRTPGR
jgi:hypothetical protein